MTKSLLVLSILIISYCSYAQTFNPTYSINAAGAVDTFKGGYTFAYATSGSPWDGALMSFGGVVNNYDCQISAQYGAGGKHISFRTRNGDYSSWNSWFEIWHSGNLNRSDVDFTAKTVNSTNVYNNGNLWSKQIVVAVTNPWPDYVFKSTYKLPSLTEVNTYIDQNHHLPDVPSAAEVEKNGLNLGDMNKVLVQKVEELTLYLIEEHKQNTNQQDEINQLKQQLNTLTKSISKN